MSECFTLFPNVLSVYFYNCFCFVFSPSFSKDSILSWHFCDYGTGMLRKCHFQGSKVAYILHSYHWASFLWLDHFRTFCYQAGLCMGSCKGKFDGRQIEAVILPSVWSTCAVWIQSCLLSWSANLEIGRPNGSWIELISGNVI